MKRTDKEIYERVLDDHLAMDSLKHLIYDMIAYPGENKGEAKLFLKELADAVEKYREDDDYVMDETMLGRGGE